MLLKIYKLIISGQFSYKKYKNKTFLINPPRSLNTYMPGERFLHFTNIMVEKKINIFPWWLCKLCFLYDLRNSQMLLLEKLIKLVGQCLKDINTSMRFYAFISRTIFKYDFAKKKYVARFHSCILLN